MTCVKSEKTLVINPVMAPTAIAATNSSQFHELSDIATHAPAGGIATIS